LSDDFNGPTNALEPVNQIPYSIEAANLKDWGSGAPETNMFLPKKDATVHNEVTLVSFSATSLCVFIMLLIQTTC
jgi:hypothetical protein